MEARRAGRGQISVIESELKNVLWANNFNLTQWHFRVLAYLAENVLKLLDKSVRCAVLKNVPVVVESHSDLVAFGLRVAKQNDGRAGKLGVIFQNVRIHIILRENPSGQGFLWRLDADISLETARDCSLGTGILDAL